MITIKLPVINIIDITNYLKQYNNIVRFSYNRRKENLNQSEIEKLVKSKMNNIELMDSSFIKAATDNSKSLNTEDNVVFGGKSNWTRYNKNLITKEEYQVNKLKSLTVRGSRLDHKGNRKFQLNMNNNEIIFKPNKKTKITLRIPNTRHDKTLIKLQELCELGETYFTCGVTNTHVFITFDETILREEKYFPVNKRTLSIDLNPNYISYVITDNNKVIHKEIIGLSELNKAKTNKKKHEDFEISKRIVNIAKHYKVKHIIYEKLSIQSSDKGKGKWFNKLVNNNWRRSRFISNLVKRCNIIGILTQEVIANYSSFIGQIDNENEYDSIAAAIELSRRGNLYLEKYYYKVDVEIVGQIIRVNEKLSDDLADRWKKKLNYDGVLDTYKSLYDIIKNAKYSYRKLFQFNWFSLRLKSSKSLVYVYS
jgi:IS605 OrfB family transposase